MDIDVFDSKLSNMESDLRSFIERHQDKSREVDARLLTMEQALVSRPGGGGFGTDDKTIGQQIIESEGFTQLVKGARSSGRIPFKSLTPHELKIISGSWSAAPDYRPVVAFPPQPALPVRALMPSIPTTSNLVEYPVEVSFTNAADYQVTEGTDKPQSDATYTLQQQPICTIAHWLAASRQLPDDSTAFSSYVNARLIHKIELVIEQEILFGTGATGHLKGLWPSATPATETQTGLADSVGASLGQLWAGHSNKSVTDGYVQLADDDQFRRSAVEQAGLGLQRKSPYLFPSVPLTGMMNNSSQVLVV